MKSAVFLTMSVVVLAACGKAADAPADKVPASASSAASNMADAGNMDVMMMAMQGKAMAHDEAVKAMHERHEGMERMGKAQKAAGRTLKSGSPDFTVVRTSAATIARLAPQTTGWFPPGTGPDVGKTGAKPDIWRKPADFIARDTAFRQAAAAFDAAAKAGDMGAIQARFAALGKTCKSCHDNYRSEMHH